MEFAICLDLHERHEDLQELLRLLPSAVTRHCPLPVGDIWILARSASPGEKWRLVLVIERKAKRDAISSLRDGRYKDQSQRLATLPIPLGRIIWLFEMSNSEWQRDERWLRGMHASILSRGMNPQRSFKPADTVQLVKDVLRKLREHITPDSAGWHEILEFDPLLDHIAKEMKAAADQQQDEGKQEEIRKTYRSIMALLLNLRGQAADLADLTDPGGPDDDAAAKTACNRDDKEGKKKKREK